MSMKGGIREGSRRFLKGAIVMQTTSGQRVYEVEDVLGKDNLLKLPQDEVESQEGLLAIEEEFII